VVVSTVQTQAPAAVHCPIAPPVAVQLSPVQSESAQSVSPSQSSSVPSEQEVSVAAVPVQTQAVPTHCPVPPAGVVQVRALQLGSAQSTCPFELSSTPLVQFSTPVNRTVA
jgi:hypothetical protein